MPFPFRHPNGNTCCSSRESCCDRCKQKLAEEALRAAEDFTPPDSYEPTLRRLRAAMTMTPAQQFAAQYQDERRREFATEATAALRTTEQQPAPRLTAAELAAWVPPDPYREDIRKLQERRR